ncbi:MAG: hypothetical protein WC856_07690 [Methylococcaceae bacterium]|jgi:hypothetical protein
MNKFNNLRVLTDTYFSRIATPIRGFGDMPIGDAHSGPLCGDRNMPFILGAGAATIGSIAAIGAASGFVATAVAVAATVSVVATIAGVALTVVGAVTGDKDLMKIGAIVGIAGGVTGLATGAFGGATAAASEVAAAGDVAAPAASATATTAAKGGLLAGSNAASNTITPAFSSVGAQAINATPALTATAGESALSTLGAIGQVGSIGSTAAQAVTPSSRGGAVQPSTYIPPDSLSTSGANAPVTIGASSPQVPDVAKGMTKNSGSYFDELMSPKNMAQMTGPALVGIGSGVIQGMKSDQQSVAQNRQVDLNQQDLEFQRMKDARTYANANTQGYNGMATRPLTQEEYDRAKLDKARLATQQAGLLTQTA